MVWSPGGSVVQAHVALVERDRLLDREVDVGVVLVPVAGREGSCVDRCLLIAPVDITAAGVDGKTEHAEQHQDEQRDQDDRLSLLQVPPRGPSSNIQHGKPHMQ